MGKASKGRHVNHIYKYCFSSRHHETMPALQCPAKLKMDSEHRDTALLISIRLQKFGAGMARVLRSHWPCFKAFNEDWAEFETIFTGSSSITEISGYVSGGSSQNSRSDSIWRSLNCGHCVQRSCSEIYSSSIWIIGWPQGPFAVHAHLRVITVVRCKPMGHLDVNRWLTTIEATSRDILDSILLPR